VSVKKERGRDKYEALPEHPHEKVDDNQSDNRERRELGVIIGVTIWMPSDYNKFSRDGADGT